MPTKPERQFTLADAMILVGATAVGLALSKTWSLQRPNEVSEWIFIASGPFRTLAPVSYKVIIYWPVVAMWTLALLALRLRRPRPIGRRLFAPPGVAACVGAVAVVLLEGSANVLGTAFYNRALPTATVTDLTSTNLAIPGLKACASASVGFGVAAVWIAMAMARRWRPEPTWIDRAGRVIGLLWIVLIPIRFPVDI